jgi:hypothetical protein
MTSPIKTVLVVHARRVNGGTKHRMTVEMQEADTGYGRCLNAGCKAVFRGGNGPIGPGTDRATLRGEVGFDTKSTTRAHERHFGRLSLSANWSLLALALRLPLDRSLQAQVAVASGRQQDLRPQALLNPC